MINRLVDPINLNAESEALLMNALSQLGNGYCYLPAGTMLNSFTLDAGLQIPCVIELKNTLIKRASVSHPDQCRYEAIDIKELGSGTYGIVYEVLKTLNVTDTGIIGKNHNKRVVKFLKLRANDIKEIENEVILTNLSNGLKIKPEIIVVPNSDGSTDVILIMEKLSGMELFDFMVLDKEKNLINTQQRLKITLNLLKAYKKQIYDKGIIHRDLKPENIYINEKTGEIVIYDFGYARDLQSSGQNFHRVQGTLGYIAPETFAGKITRTTDLYSLAIIIACLWGADEPPEVQVFEPYTFKNLRAFLFNSKNKFPVKVANMFYDLLESMTLKDPNARPDIDSIIADMEKIILEYHADENAYILEVTISDIAVNRTNELLEKNKKIEQILDIIKSGLAAIPIGEENVYKHFITKVDCYVLSDIKEPNAEKILAKTDAVVRYYQKIKNHLIHMRESAKKINFERTSNKNYVMNELDYWMKRVEECPANLDKIYKLCTDVLKEKVKLEKYIIDHQLVTNNNENVTPVNAKRTYEENSDMLSECPHKNKKNTYGN